MAPLVEPDFSEVADEVVPGTYKGVIKKGELKEYNSGSGSYVNWEIETYGEENTKNNGRRIFHRTATSGKGAFQLQKFFRAATGEVLSGSFDTEKLVGRKVQVTVAEQLDRETKQPTGYLEVKKVEAVN